MRITTTIVVESDEMAEAAGAESRVVLPWVGLLSSAATNRTDEGRAMNRRVVLVER